MPRRDSSVQDDVLDLKSGDADASPDRTGMSSLLLRRVGLGVVVLITALLFGRFASEKIPEIERWIASLGMLGPIVFVVLLIAFTSVFVPDTLFAIIAGAIFGLGWGTVYVVVGALLTSILNFWMARRVLRTRVLDILSHHPKLTAIERAGSRDGLRLLTLLRLSPINPVTISYVMGVSRMRFGPFLLATCAMIPGIFVEVYFGYLTTHVSKVAGNVTNGSTLRTTVTIAGFIVCAITLLYVTRLAHAALKDAETT